MISERHEQLIQDVLEGDASPPERTELDRLIVSDPAVRERYEEMCGVFRMLAESREAALPANLHADIMSTVAAEQSHGPAIAPPRRNLVPVLGAFLAGAAAAALVVVSVIRGPVGGMAPHSAATSGTMAPVLPSRALPLSTATLHTAHGDIELSTARDANTVLLKIRSLSDRGLLVVEFSPDSIEFQGVRWQNHSTLPASMMAGRVSITVEISMEAALTFRPIHSTDAVLRVRDADTGAGVPSSDSVTGGVVLHTTPQPAQ